MAVVIELLSRSGKLLERHRFSAGLISIGRSYENDVIISDPYVDPFHLSVELMDDGAFIVHDNATVNGVKVQGRKRIEVSEAIKSGDTVDLGRSRLRIINPYQGVSPAEALSVPDKLFNRLSSGPLLFILLLLNVGVELLTSYNRSFGPFDVGEYSNNLLYSALILVGYTIFWSSLGKFLRGESRFISHASYISIVLILFWLGGLVKVVLTYNFNANIVLMVLTWGFLSIVAFASVWLGLHVATRFGRWLEWVIAIVVVLAFLFYEVLGYMNKAEKFSPFPNHNSVLLAPVFQIKTPVAVEQYLQQLDALFDATLTKGRDETAGENEEITQD